MIRYSRDSIWTLFYWWGGITRNVAKPALCYLIYLLLVYICGIDLGHLQVQRASVHSLGGFVMFLLVFRLNQCMARATLGNELSAAMFSELEFMLQTFCTCMRGTNQLILEAERPSKETEEEMQCRADLCTASKVNVARLTIVLALSFVAHCWLLDAASGGQGVLDDEIMCQVVFVLMRIEALLYPEELQIIDEALCIRIEKPDETPQEPRQSRLVTRAVRWIQAIGEGASEPIVRTEVNRHCLDADVGGERLIGRRCASGEMSFAPLPKITQQLLLDAVLLPADLPWGYQQRIASSFVGWIGQASSKMEEMFRLVSQPLPLAYLQHCRLLLLLYAVLYPMSVDAEEGVCENVVMPLIIFTTLFGFEVLSSDMENPLGISEMDLHLLDMVHSLEVVTQHAFDLSELGERCTRMALRRPLVEFGMQTQVQSLVRWKHVEDHTSTFSTFFSWEPMPTLILGMLTLSHGHVDIVHEARLFGGSLRGLLRSSLRRRHTEASPNQGAVLEQLGSDPMTWCHCLVLNRKPGLLGNKASSSMGTAPEPSPRDWHRPWTSNMGPLLAGTMAGPLFEVEGDEDSARSIFRNAASDPSEVPQRARSGAEQLVMEIEAAGGTDGWFQADCPGCRAHPIHEKKKEKALRLHGERRHLLHADDAAIEHHAVACDDDGDDD